MIRSFLRSATGRVCMLALVGALSGCTANYATENSSTVLFILTALNKGGPLRSDVLTGPNAFADTIQAEFAIRFKNPNISTIPQIPSAVIVDRYEIKYRRSDGRGVEGQDVPFSISGNLTTGFDVAASGVGAVTIEVVRAQAKIEPPLRNLRSADPTQQGTQQLGGALILTVFADITFHGHTISGQTVTASGSLQIDFADYADN